MRMPLAYAIRSYTGGLVEIEMGLSADGFQLTLFKYNFTISIVTKTIKTINEIIKLIPNIIRIASPLYPNAAPTNIRIADTNTTASMMNIVLSFPSDGYNTRYNARGNSIHANTIPNVRTS